MLIYFVKGIIGNVAAIALLTRPQIRSCFFNQLLAVLATFDILYITTMMIESLKTLRPDILETDIYTKTFPIFLYPLNHISMTGSIFTTVGVTLDDWEIQQIAVLPSLSPKIYGFEEKSEAKNLAENDVLDGKGPKPFGRTIDEYIPSYNVVINKCCIIASPAIVATDLCLVVLTSLMVTTTAVFHHLQMDRNNVNIPGLVMVESLM